jgi:hypothetical protein
MGTWLLVLGSLNGMLLLWFLMSCKVGYWLLEKLGHFGRTDCRPSTTVHLLI